MTECNFHSKKALGSIFSFFSGSGFLDLGFESEGFRVELVNEYNTDFLKAYQYNREKFKIKPPKYGHHLCSVEEFLSNSIFSEQVKASKSKGLVGFIGGPPCPDFSVAGKQAGKHGENGKLSRTYIDIILQEKPDWFLFENVKGLYRTAKHRAFFDELKHDLLNAGYSMAERLVNALEYGAPQHRERIILIGFSESLRSKLGLPEGEIGEQQFPWKKYAQRDASFLIKNKEQTPRDQTVQYWFELNKVTEHPNNRGFVPRAALSKFLTIQEGDDSRKSGKRLHRNQFSPTACYGNNEVHIHPTEPRRITVAEALAIQTLPKEFSFPDDMSLSSMFKTIGNGVPFILAKGLAKTLKSMLASLSNEP